MKKRNTLEKKICESYLCDTRMSRILKDNLSAISNTDPLEMRHVNNFSHEVFKHLIEWYFFDIVELVGTRSINFSILKKEVTKRCKPVLENYINNNNLNKSPKLKI